MYAKDKRIVVTLDAGGTNLVFNAIKENKEITKSLKKTTHSDNLDLCIQSIRDGFAEIIERLDAKPVAISFAFPGPADYPNGVIGGFLPNFPSFRDGVALGPYLEKEFKIPVFINNDADLFVYGEALAGALPRINEKLAHFGSDKKYQNLIGFTWGTGLGVGITVNQRLHIGDNSCSEVFCLPQRDNSNIIVEDGASIRAIQRVYGEKSGNQNHKLEPDEIFQIAEGTREGDRQAAIDAFAAFGEIAGDVIATVVTLIDGLVVIGGGISNAAKYIMPSVLKVLHSKIVTVSGETLNRVQMKTYNLDDDNEFKCFVQGESRKIKIYGYEEEITYDPLKRIGITISTLDTSHAVALGAYAFALHSIDNQ